MKTITEKELKKIIADLTVKEEQTRILIVAKDNAKSTDLFNRYNHLFGKETISRAESFDYHINGLHLVSFRCQERAREYVDENIIGVMDEFYQEVYKI